MKSNMQIISMYAFSGYFGSCLFGDDEITESYIISTIDEFCEEDHVICEDGYIILENVCISFDIDYLKLLKHVTSHITN